MKNRKLFLGTTGILCIVFCLFLPFFFGLRFLLPILMPEDTSSQVLEDAVTPDECSPLEAWQLCQSALVQAGEFSTVSEGIIDTQVLLFNYQQLINNRRVVSASGVSLSQMNTGALANVGLQQYLDGDKAYLRPCQIVGSNHMSWADEPYAVSMNAYYDAFGPAFDGLSAYLLNERTLVSGFYLYENDGIYSFSFQLSAEAALYYGRSLRTLFQLEEDPAFKSIDITLDMDSSFRPIRAEYKEEYTISMDLIGETVCRAKYVETFSYDSVVHPDEAFFQSYSHLNAESKVPALSTGYNCLFSLFGNSNTYDAVLSLPGEELPMKISFDTNGESIFAIGDTFSLAYFDRHYYIDFAENKLSSGADALNNKLRTLGNIGGSSAPGTDNEPPNSDSLMDGISIQNENGKMIVSSDSSDVSFRVVLDVASMTVEELSVDLVVAGENGTLYMKQSDARIDLPSLSGYTDLTPALDSLDILLEILRQPNTYYHVEMLGDVQLDANAILSVGESIALSMAFLNQDVPTELFLTENSALAILGDLAVSGSLDEFRDLVGLFSQSEPTVADESGLSASGLRVSVEGDKIAVRFGEALTARVLFGGDSCIYENGSTVVQITKTGHGSQSATEIPAVKHTVYASALTEFLNGSVYPELFSAKSIYAKLDIRSSEGRFDADAVALLSPDMILKLSTSLEGERVDLFYKKDTVYLSNKLFNAFLPAEKLQMLSEDSGALFSAKSVESLNASKSPSMVLKSVSIEAHQIKLKFDSFTLFLAKDSFRIVSGDTTIRSKDLYGSKNTAAIEVPLKKDCIDLEDLLEKLSCLEAKKELAFSGSYYNDLVAVLINRLDVQLSENGSVSKFAMETVVSNKISQPVKLFYDTEAFYADIGGIKLLSMISDDSTASGSTANDSLGAAALPVGGFFAELSSLQSITYKNGTLTVSTEEGTLSLGWVGDDLNVIRYSSEDSVLLLVACDPRPIVMPSRANYTDLTEFGELMGAIVNTLDSKSFRIDGSLDLKVFSFALDNVSLSGSVSFESGHLTGDITFEVPYFLGLTSRDIPRGSKYGSLRNCTIINRVLILDDNIYIAKEIRAEYGSSHTEVVVLSEKRYVSIEEFWNDPTPAIAFLLNLEEGILPEDTETSEPDEKPDVSDKDPDPFFSNTPFEDIYEEDGHYVFEISPEYLSDSIELFTLLVYTDGEYVTRVESLVDFSVFTIDASVAIRDHGAVEVTRPEESVLGAFLPLQG